MPVQCKCGRFLANARAISSQDGEGYSWHMFLADVRGDCSRCGPDSQATREGDMCWWWSWDAWQWPAELDAA